MFEVSCPSCKTSYQVDERRVPTSGLKMRCPKCGDSFQVEARKSPAEPVLGAALGLGQRKAGLPQSTMLGMPEPRGAGLPALPSRAVQPGAAARRTAAGAEGAALPSPAAPRGLKSTMIGVAPAQAPSAAAEASFELDSVDELDLFADQEEDLEADLPTAARPASIPREQPRARSGAAKSPRSNDAATEIDLPAMNTLDAEPAEADEWDQAELPDIPGALLPEPRAHRPLTSTIDPFDLPTVAGGSGVSNWGPGPRGTKKDTFVTEPPSSLDDPGFPDLGADLPDLDAGLPSLGGNLPGMNFGLPAISSLLPATAATQLPSPTGQLPSPSGQLPSPAAQLPRPTAQLPEAAPQLPNQAGQLPSPTAAGPVVSPVRDPSAFGEVNLHPGQEDEFDAFPTQEDASPRGPSSVGGGSGYGEVALDDDLGGLSLGEEVERGPAPRGPSAAMSAPVELPRGPSHPAVAVGRRARVSVKTKAIVVGALTFAIAGGALALLPDVGPYGAYFFLDTIQAGSHEKALAGDVQSASARLAKDTVKEVDAAFRELDRGRADAPRYRARAAYTAYLALMRQVRFGEDSNVVAQGKVLLEGLKEELPADVEHLELARLADLVAKKKFAEVAKTNVSGRSADFNAVAGEAALGLGDAEVALRAFERVLAGGPSARGHFGLARAYQLARDVDKARAHTAKTLALMPGHTGAVLLDAQLHSADRGQDAEWVSRLGSLTEPASGSSSGERVLAFTVLGEIHLLRSRIKQAEAAFHAALKLEGGNARAQRGLADALFNSGRYGEALARYEAATKADPLDLDAALGVVRTKLRLEGVEEATHQLERLVKSYPRSTAVAYWEGQAKEAAGSRETAQRSYERAIELGENRPELVGSFVALTRVLGQVGKLDEAAAVIARAEKRFPKNPDVYRALGELSSSRGAYDDAITQFDKALDLDPDNIGIHFSRGVALRQARRFEEAALAFDRVERGEKDYPGLALERGNLFEASGRSEEALAAYESALAQAPKDPDLMLRVGCGKAAAGQTKDAQQLLSKVMADRPNSAEVNFCTGLALLKEGRDFPEAKRFLERAVGLDSTRAQYYLYVGAVAIELHDYGLANKALDHALELDRTLADAYWQRGVLRVRQGAVKDAELDLRKALSLNPSRFEAHAALAESYMQINKEQDALVEWKAAVQTGHGDPFWHYRYGKLLLDNRQAEEARAQLQLAVDQGDKLQPAPPWLWEAHRNLALSMGRTKEAVPHWQIFLENAGKNSPYAREALRELAAIMK